MTEQQIINIIADKTIKSDSQKLGLFNSVTIAQYLIETGFKISRLARVYNNYFGVKAHKDWKGKKVYMETGEETKDGKKYYIYDWFRVYDKPQDSFTDRIKFLKTYKRYKPVFAAKTPEEQAYALQNAGYATARNYAKKMIKLINDYNLKQYDNINTNKIPVETIVLIIAAIVAFGTIIYKMRKKDA